MNLSCFAQYRLTIATLLLLCVTTGCGGRASANTKGSVKKAPVSGTVTLAGQPLEGAEVYFYTDKFTGFAKTDPQGKFKLAQGAAIGPNKVYISKLEGGAVALTSDPVMALNDPGQVAAATQASSFINQPKQLIPLEFSSQATTKLTFEVAEDGAKDADFNL